MEQSQFVITQGQLDDQMTNESIVGRKALGLVPAIAHDLPVPPFFVITTTVYNTFIKNVLNNLNSTNVKTFLKQIKRSSFPQTIKNAIKKEYAKLNIIGKSWVAVRSSIAAPQYPNLSFSGLLDTYLNVHGFKELEEAIKRVYASMLAQPMLTYIKSNNLKIQNLSIAIIVQRMVASEISGITYSYNPITEQQDQIVTQAVFGLGDVIGTGEINPDVYISDKATLKLIEKKIFPQFWLETRDYDEQHETFHNKRIELSPVWQFSQKLTEEQIGSLANMILLLQKSISGRFLIEWTITNNKIYILQIKTIDAPINQQTQIPNTLSTPQKQSPKSMKEKRRTSEPALPSTSPDDTPIVTGMPLVKGTVQGRLFILTQRAWERNKQKILRQLKHKKNIILVTNFFNASLEILLPKVKGLIADTGGPNSDLAILLKEQNIPTITQTRIGTRLLQNNSKIILNATEGAVYPYTPTMDSGSSSPSTKTSIDNENASTTPINSPSKIEFTINTPVTLFAKDPSWPLYWLPNVLEYHIRHLKRFPQYQQIILNYSDKINPLEFSKRFMVLKSKVQEYLIIAINHKDKQDFLQIKRKLAESDIRRNSTTKIVPVLTKPIQVIKLHEYPFHFIDGIILDLPALYEALGGTSSIIKDSEFLEFLSLNLQKIQEEKLAVIGAIIDIHCNSKLLRFVRLGINAFISNRKGMTSPQKIQETLHKLSNGALI